MRAAKKNGAASGRPADAPICYTPQGFMDRRLGEQTIFSEAGMAATRHSRTSEFGRWHSYLSPCLGVRGGSKYF
jgi:hypothetical protein